ncbi:ester cyclase [Streptomyces sp. NBC_00691]|uniref:ester cyclase n=1 Tax=Streptomyces sp. NBC_00691 TaxID=2903671 RepID=UPI002E3382E9|nr:ester cyclase [Streptomyces sp. NBC_00691]
MTFTQIIDFKTSRVDDMSRLMDRWIEQTKGKRTATHSVLGKDRADSTHLVEIVEFPSYDVAMRNSQLPETDRIFREMVALCDEMPTFTDLDVVRDEAMYKANARRLLEMIATEPELALLDEVLAEGYHDHDPANEQDVMGMDAVRREVEMWRSGFDFAFTVDDQIAEGDRVCTRWTWNGTHSGDFMGLQPSGIAVTMTGAVIHRFRDDGKIVEGWWQYDLLGLMAQLGAVEG